MTRPASQAEALDAIARDPKPLMHPDFGGCRWPLYRLDRHGEVLFCCNGRPMLQPYCDAHQQIALGKPWRGRL